MYNLFWMRLIKINRFAAVIILKQSMIIIYCSKKNPFMDSEKST